MAKRKINRLSWHEIVLFLFLFFFACIIFLILFRDSLEYKQFKDKPLVVQAVVSKHTSKYDSEDNKTTYYSFVKYTVDGKEYEIKHQSVERKGDLTDVGETVTIEIAPISHDTKLESLKISVYFLPVITAVILLAFGVLRVRLKTKVRFADYDYILNIDAVKKDLKYEYTHNPFFGTILTYIIILVWLVVFFPALNTFLFWAWFVVCVVACVIFVGYILSYISFIKAGRFCLMRETVIRKYIGHSKNSEGEKVQEYCVVFKSSSGTRTVFVSEKDMNVFTVGDSVCSVLLNEEAEEEEVIFYILKDIND